jgi:hypothetical protein
VKGLLVSLKNIIVEIFARLYFQMSINNGLDKANQEQEPPAWDTLRSLCKTNLEHFDLHQDEAGMRIKGALLVVIDTLENTRPLYTEISKIAPLFDFDENTPGNGYRSFLFLVDKCIMHSILVCQELNNQKNSMLFRKSYHMRFVLFYNTRVLLNYLIVEYKKLNAIHYMIYNHMCTYYIRYKLLIIKTFYQ